MATKNPPTSYLDVKGRVEQSLFSYEAADLCAFLSIETPLGLIVPEDHIDELDFYSAVVHLNNTSDSLLLEEIHRTLEFYIENKIRIFNLEASRFFDENYETNLLFDKKYLWAEKYYFDMFGLWSPRMILIHLLCPDGGFAVIFEEENFNKYTFCPMSESEVSESDCKMCPFSVLKEDGKNTVKCRYRIKIS